jgi:hypothetical protein
MKTHREYSIMLNSTVVVLRCGFNTNTNYKANTTAQLHPPAQKKDYTNKTRRSNNSDIKGRAI